MSSWAAVFGEADRGLSDLQPARMPQYIVALDLAHGDPHRGRYTRVWRGYDDSLPADRLTYAALAAGQYQVEGGFLCEPGCGGHHPALEVSRQDDWGAACKVLYKRP